MMNCKIFGKKWLSHNFKELSRHSPGETEKNYEKSQVRIAGLRTEI
jgi:hypothetical protein